MKKLFIILGLVGVIVLGGCIQRSECGNTICEMTKVPPETHESCPQDCPTLESHYKCVFGNCVEVPGAGVDECKSNADCVVETHFECREQKCVVVSGSGTSQCKADVDCIAAVCGNAICEISETAESCPADCADLNLEIAIQTEKEAYLKGETIILTDPPSAAPTLSFSEQGVEDKQIVANYFFERSIPRDFSKLGLVDYNAFAAKEKPKVKGYIVKLKDKPLIAKINELESKLKKGLISAGIAAAQYDYYKKQLASAQQAAIQSFRNILAQPKVRQQFVKVLNAVSLDISEKEAEKLLQSPYVEEIYPNYEVKIVLNESVPQINADKVWQLKDTNDNNITGKGITIAIIDTGVDYRHPSLGSCFVEQPTETCFPEKRKVDGNCIDSDGGINVCHFGYAMETSPWGGYNMALDYCNFWGNTPTGYISEYYCNNDEFERQQVFCENGCLGGMCITKNNINDGTCKKVIGGYDFANNDNDPIDDQGHGTHVAGIAAGNGALKGVAPDAKLLAYKVLDGGGSGYYDWIIAGIERAVDPNQDGNTADHANIISMSLGLPYFAGGGPDDPMSQAIDNAVDAGIVAVIAAGNEGEGGRMTIASPGAARNAITVGATCKEKLVDDLCVADIVSFSSRGPNKAMGVKPDVVAPGVRICAAQHDAAFEMQGASLCLGEDHIAISGTSMATPHIAGAAALLLQAHPNWTPVEIKAALMETAKTGTTAQRVHGNLNGKLRLERSLGKEFCLKFELEMQSKIVAGIVLGSDWDTRGIFGRRALIRNGVENPGEIIQEKEWPYIYSAERPYIWLYTDFNVLPQGSYWFCTETEYEKGDPRYGDVFFLFANEDKFLEKYFYGGQWLELQGKDLRMYVTHKVASTRFEEGGGEADVFGAVDTPFIVTPSPIDLKANYKASSYTLDFTAAIKNIKSAAGSFSVSAELDPYSEGALVSVSPTTVSFGENKFTLRIYNPKGEPFADNSLYSGTIKFYSVADKKTLRVPFSFYVDYTPPRLEYIRPYIEIYDENKYTVGVSAITDEISRIKMHYRLRGDAEFKEIDFGTSYEKGYYGLWEEYYIHEKELDLSAGVYEFYLNATNLSGLATTEDNDGKLFRLTVPASFGKKINSSGYEIVGKLPLNNYFAKDAEGKDIDLDKDGKKELISYRQDSNIIMVLENQGNNLFVNDYNITAPLSKYGEINDLAISDLDGDGLTELAYIQSCGGLTQEPVCRSTLDILEATPDNPYPNRLILHDADENYEFHLLQIADLDEDGKKEIITNILDLRRSAQEMPKLRFYESSADNKFEIVAELSYENPTMLKGIITGDVDSDSKKELLAVTFEGEIKMFKSTGDNLFEEVYSAFATELQVNATEIGVGDLDRDGKKEIIIGQIQPMFDPGSDLYLLYSILEFDGNGFKLGGSIKKVIWLTDYYGIRISNLGNGPNQELIFVGKDTFIFDTLNTFNGIEPTYYMQASGGNAATFDHDNSGCSKLILNSFNANYSAIYSFPCAQKEKSQIKNNGSKSVQGKLSMKIQYWGGGNWIDEKIVVNEEIISIEAGGIFALDNEWSTNGAYLAEKSGHFRVLASFQVAGQEIEDNYEFLIE